MNMNNELRNLFLDELEEILDAERQLLKALPKMAKTAKSGALREAIESHLEETESHVSRLEEVFEVLSERRKPERSQAMEGLLEEGRQLLEQMKGSSALDAALIASAQKIEHFEIATYGTLCTWAEMLDYQEALELLKETLMEEKAADETLTEIAETVANIRAEEG